MFGKRFAIGLTWLLACAASASKAADGTWTANSNGNWSDTTKWDSGIVADGAGFTAFLSNVINADRTITLDAARTIGNITAQDTSNNYTISGANTLTFEGTSPTVSVVANRTLIFNGTTFAGTDGLTFNGPGNFQIWQATLNHTGGTIVDGGAALLTNNNLGSGNWRLNNGVLSDRYRQTTTFSGGLGAGNNQVQIYGDSGFGGGNANSNWRIGAQNSVLKWGTVGEGATGFFNPTTLKFFSAVDNMGTSIYGQITLQNGIDLNSGARTIDVLQAAGPNAILSSWAKIDTGITDTGSGGSLTKTGGGNLLIAGTSDYTGGTTINAGAVRFDRIAAMPSSGNVQVNDGAILGVRVGGTGNWSGAASGVGTLGGLIGGLGGAGTSTVSYNGNVGLLLDVTTNTTSSATITDAGATSLALYKMGGSSLTLNGTNTHTGGTFLQQGTLVADSAGALSSGDITFRGGTLQYTANSAAANFGSQIKNSTSAILLNTNGQDVTLSSLGSGNTGGLTKSGNGKLTLTGTNTYSGTTTLSAGTIAVYDGTLTTSGGAVSMTSNTTISVLGGTGVSSTWNLGGQQFGTANNNNTNVQVVVDGDGVAGSALVTNVGILNWGRTATGNSTLQLTNGGQVNVTNEVRIGNPYYSTAGGANITIGGGTATSTFSGDGGDDFYIGYGERRGATNNVVTVSSGGVLTNIRDMFVGHVNNAQNAGAPPASGNQLTVTGTGTASMRGISVGYAQVGFEANANLVEVTSGGSLSTTGAAYIGRGNVSGSQSNSNTMTVSGAGSVWNAGNQTVYVGHTNNASAQSNNNILTVSAGGSLTNVSSLIVGFGSGTETGNQVVLNGGTISANSITVNVGNTLSGSGTLNVGTGVTVDGTLSPGNSIGTMNIGGDLTWNGTASTPWVFELGAGNTADFVDITSGDFLIGTGTPGSDFVFDFAASTDAGTFNLVSWTGTTGFSATDFSYTNLGGGNSGSFQISGSTLQFVVVPEPAALALVACGGAIGLALLRRRRAG